MKERKHYKAIKIWRGCIIGAELVVMLLLWSKESGICTHAGDFGGFDVDISVGENWSLPDNWQEDTSGWAEDADIVNSIEEKQDEFSSAADDSQQNNPQSDSSQPGSPPPDSTQPDSSQSGNSQPDNNQTDGSQSENHQSGSTQSDSSLPSTPEPGASWAGSIQPTITPPSRSKNSTRKKLLLHEQTNQIKKEHTEDAKENTNTESKVYISQKERQKCREQDQAVALRRTRDMIFLHKKQVGKDEKIYLTVTRLNVNRILSVRLNGKECAWIREGSRIVLEKEPELGKNKVEVIFFLEDGAIGSMEPWIFTVAEKTS